MLIHKHLPILLSMILSLSACGGGGGSTPSTLTDVDTSTFDGVWYSPCFNNSHGFSARQKITINGTSLISQLESHANAPAQTPNCELSSGQIITADITATLGYGSNSQESSCVDDTGVDSSISLISNNTSGVLINTQPDLTNSIELLTGRKDDFLPASTVICLKPNGNLLFAGYEYTGSTNTEIVDATTVVIPPNSAVTWKVGSYSYSGGTASGSSAYTSSGNDFGVLTVSTSGSDTSNGDYSGSAISISHTLKEAGSYSLGDTSYLVEDNYSHKRIKMTVTVGTLYTAGGSVLYSATSGTVAVTVDNNGKYHFTATSPLTFSKTVDVGNGISGSPAIISFTMSNVHNHNP